MQEIPIFRLHSERMQKDRFAAIAEHLGLKGDPVATEDALYLQGERAAVAYAQPGSRFGGLLFYTDQSQGLAEQVEKSPAERHAEAWTQEFLKRFQLEPKAPPDDRFKLSFETRLVRTEAAIEHDERGKDLKRMAIKADVVSDLTLGDIHVTGPRAKLRASFKNGKGPAWLHRGGWERLEVFEMRPMLSQHEAFRRLTEMISARGSPRKAWAMRDIRLAYFAGEFTGGPDLLLPYYFAEIEFQHRRDGGDGKNGGEAHRQGPRQLIQIPATA